jgi:hypothetical protein
MKKQNCWEFKKCGREPGGLNTKEFGECPASTEEKLNGINSGTNGGRSCWALSGTLCGSKVQGTFASKLRNCKSCKFYQMVKDEEGSEFIFSKEILAKLKSE